MDSKKDVELAKEISVKGISKAAARQNPKLMEILSFIVEELDKQFPLENNTNPKLN